MAKWAQTRDPPTPTVVDVQARVRACYPELSFFEGGEGNKKQDRKREEKITCQIRKHPRERPEDRRTLNQQNVGGEGRIWGEEEPGQKSNKGQKL